MMDDFESPAVRAARAQENRFVTLENGVGNVQAAVRELKDLVLKNDADSRERDKENLEESKKTNGTVTGLVEATKDELEWRESFSADYAEVKKRVNALWGKSLDSVVVRNVWKSQIRWMLAGGAIAGSVATAISMLI